MQTPVQDQWAEWLLKRRYSGDSRKHEVEMKGPHPLREQVLQNAKIAAGDVVLDVGTGDGLIAFGAIDQVGEQGQVIFSDISEYMLEYCQTRAQELGILSRCRFLNASATDFSVLEKQSVDVVTVRSVLIYVAEKQAAFREFYRLLKPKGRLSIFEPINRFSHSTSLNKFGGYDITPIQDLAQKVQALYDKILPPETDPMLNFDERDLLSFAEQAGFEELRIKWEAVIQPDIARDWQEFSNMAFAPQLPTLNEALSETLTAAEIKRFEGSLRPLVEAGQGVIRGASCFLWAVKH